MSTFSLKSLLKVLISLVLVYHLFMILLLPQFRFTHHQGWMNYFKFYQFIFSFNNRWDKYSIQLLPKFYLKYEVLEQSKGKKSKTFIWPPSHEEHLIFNHKRLVNNTMHLINRGPVNVQRYLLPWLCRKHENARLIKAEAIAISKKAGNRRGRLFKGPSGVKRDKKDNVLFSVSKRCPSRSFGTRTKKK